MHAALTAQFRQQYGAAPEVVARAPGRIEFIGNHTDYNGGTVLGAAIDRGVWVGFRQRSDSVLRLASGNSGITTLKTADIRQQSGPAAWCNYPLGVWQALKEFDLRQPAGGDYLALSDLPTGAGLSSSAAIELASALCFLAVTKQNPPRETVVKLARHAENRFVGVPCGILDQGVSGFGRKDHLVFIDCRGPDFATVPMPEGVVFWVFNTHTQHALVEGLYAARHRECTEAAKALGVALLADAAPAMVEENKAKLPDVLHKRAKHIVEEIARVAAVRAALQQGDLKSVGAALTASHRSSQHLFENSTVKLDFLADTLASQPRVFGARLTGGGFGGAVLAMTDASFSQSDATEVASACARQFQAAPDILRLATADGAAVI